MQRLLRFGGRLNRVQAVQDKGDGSVGSTCATTRRGSTMSHTTPPHVHAEHGSRTEDLSILVATADAGTATTFALWLEADFETVETVTNPAHVRDHLSEGLGVVIMDEAMATSATVLTDIADRGQNPRVVVIGDSGELPPAHVDDALTPPVGRMELCNTVRALHRQAQYDRCVATLYELATTRADVVTDGGEVEPRLDELEARIESIRQTTDRTIEEFDEQDFKALLRGTGVH